MTEAETYQVRDYPLEIEQTTDDRVFSKGWHPRAEFVKEANWEASLEDWHPFWEEGDIRYEVWRCVPGGPEDPVDVWYYPAQLGAHGAFPVTVVGG